MEEDSLECCLECTHCWSASIGGEYVGVLARVLLFCVRALELGAYGY